MKKANVSDSEKLPFHALIAGSLVSGAAQVLGNPLGLSNSGRALAIADAWSLFKITKLAFRLHPTTLAVNPTAAGWVGGVQDTNPANVAQTMELLPSVLLMDKQVTPSDWIRPTRSELSGEQPWYKTIQGTFPTGEEYPGIIAVTGTGTGPFTLEIRGELLMKTAVATGNTPEEANLRARMRELKLNQQKRVEQARMLAVLGSTQVPPSGISFSAPK